MIIIHSLRQKAVCYEKYYGSKAFQRQRNEVIFSILQLRFASKELNTASIDSTNVLDTYYKLILQKYNVS